MATTGGRDQQAQLEDIEIWLISDGIVNADRPLWKGMCCCDHAAVAYTAKKSAAAPGWPADDRKDSPSTRTGRPAVDSRKYRSRYLAANPKRPHDQADAQLERTPNARET